MKKILLRRKRKKKKMGNISLPKKGRVGPPEAVASCRHQENFGIHP